MHDDKKFRYIKIAQSLQWKRNIRGIVLNKGQTFRQHMSDLDHIPNVVGPLTQILPLA